MAAFDFRNELFVQIDPQVHVGSITVVELADRLSVAALAVDLGVHLVVDVALQLRKAVGPVLLGKEGSYAEVLLVLEVDHSVWDRLIVLVDYDPGQDTLIGVVGSPGGVVAPRRMGEGNLKLRDGACREKQNREQKD